MHAMEHNDLGHFDHSSVGESPLVLNLSTVAISYRGAYNSQPIVLQSVTMPIQKRSRLKK
jgi:hypothetical protein